MEAVRADEAHPAASNASMVIICVMAGVAVTGEPVAELK